MSLRILSPEGGVGREARQRMAAPASFAGLRVAALDNGKPGAEVLLAAIGRSFAQRTNAEYVGIHRKGSAATPCEEDLIDALTGAAGLVVTGTAD